MVAESWFRSLWKPSKKNGFHPEKVQIEVLAFEAVSLMSKLLHLWQSLVDKQVAWLREEISNSDGIKKLVSENDDYIGRLICAEMTENLTNVSRAVARLSRKCNDPLLKCFEQAFSDLIKSGADIYGWQFSWKKMDKKAKKMERFIVTNANLYQEMETLADLEQTLKRMKCNDNTDSITLVEYEKKISWKRHEVKHLKENSLWNRTYDYAILLLARSVFTIYGRIGFVFGINEVADVGVKDSRVADINNSRHNQSTVFMQSVYPSENYFPKFSSGKSGKSVSVSGPLPRTMNMHNSHSVPHGNPTATSSLISEKNNGVSFFSGPLGRSKAKAGPVSRARRNALRFWQFHDAKEKTPRQKLNGLSTSGLFTGSMMRENSSYAKSGEIHSGILNGTKDSSSNQHGYGKSIISSKNKLLNAPSETLGAAALALHYANVIIFIEKLVATHLIGNDARDELYNMLPAGIRLALRTKLKPYAKIISSLAYDTTLAEEWKGAISGTLDWLSPLAHNMIRWQSERSLEHHNLVSRMNVLLVQTLYFANQEKTEAAIIDLLVGLNYICRFGREISAKSLVPCDSGRIFDDSSD